MSNGGPTNVHPNQALFSGEKPFPVIPAAEHFCGSEKLIGKALEMQATLGPIFDITCDCEDGAPAGQEKQHAEMIVRVLTSDANQHKMAGARIHDFSHPHWRADVDILVNGAGHLLNHITIPKATSSAQVEKMIEYITSQAFKAGIRREIPIHALIETHGALREANRIAQLPWMQVMDFGLMDFVSGHHGAIPASCMRSPGQFEHALIARAKAEVVACALAHGVVPAHNVTLDLKNTETTFKDAYRARHDFGFLRMWSIYPTQVQSIVDAMRPDMAEVVDGGEILLAAQNNSWGPIQYKGELHDRATYRYFWELLQKAKITGATLDERVVKAFFQ
jgi:citrate lyase subunit beta / citryl-CoA lyase